MATSASSEALDVLEGAIATAISDGEHGGVFVQSWVLVAEFSDADGETWIGQYHSHDSRVWTRMGLLEFALTDEAGNVESMNGED